MSASARRGGDDGFPTSTGSRSVLSSKSFRRPSTHRPSATHPMCANHLVAVHSLRLGPLQGSVDIPKRPSNVARCPAGASSRHGNSISLFFSISRRRCFRYRPRHNAEARNHSCKTGLASRPFALQWRRTMYMTSYPAAIARSAVPAKRLAVCEYHATDEHAGSSGTSVGDCGRDDTTDELALGKCSFKELLKQELARLQSRKTRA